MYTTLVRASLKINILGLVKENRLMLFTVIASALCSDIYKGHISTQAWKMAECLNDAAGGM